jgi:uncharacterized protein
VLAWCLSGKHTICTFDKQCAAYIVIEHTGDCFPCDFFVDPKWYLGNILETNIGELASCKKKLAFARLKRDLSSKCLVCRHFSVCRGGCMKDKLAYDSEHFAKESYFCESYKMFFDYAMPRFMEIAAGIKAESPS